VGEERRINDGKTGEAQKGGRKGKGRGGMGEMGGEGGGEEGKWRNGSGPDKVWEEIDAPVCKRASEQAGVEKASVCRKTDSRSTVQLGLLFHR